MNASFFHPRRRFLQWLGGALVWLGLERLLVGPRTAAATRGPASEYAWAVLIDLTRCTGCNRCTLACKTVNRLPHPERVPTKLASDAYSFVAEQTVASDSTDATRVFVKHQCMHCLHPACVSACTVGALRKTAEGPVVYDAARCIGCRYCQYACPFGVPTYDWQNPLGLIHKCQMCSARLAEGQPPACVAACPTGALQFGRRRDLLRQARARIRSNPDRYVAHIYGEHEAGGTSILYLSDVPFAELGFPALPDTAVPELAETVMKQTPLVALTVATLSTGFHLLIKRRTAATNHQDKMP